MSESLVKSKSYVFALQIVKLVQDLRHDHKEFVLTKQLLRAGTSIGANIEEASAAMSRKDFAAKMSIASREARETHYWLRLLTDTGYLPAETARPVLAECDQLIRMLTAIVKSTQKQSPSETKGSNELKTQNS